MNAIERAIGRWLHRLLVRHPAAHAELLNQYRSSEDFAKRYPRTVCTELLPEGPLRTKYARHQADEERHEALYAERIAALGGAPRAVGEERDYVLAVWRRAMAAHVGIAYHRFGQRQPLDAVERTRMFALQVAVEERGLVEMALHRSVCESAGDAATAEAIARIEPDERFHAAYSRAALEEAAAEVVARGARGEKAMEPEGAALASRALAEAMLSTMRSIEDAAYRAVTAAFLRELEREALAEASAAERRMVRGLAWVVDPGGRVDGSW